MDITSAAAPHDWLSGGSSTAPAVDANLQRLSLRRLASLPPSVGATVGATIRRVTAILVLGWLGYFGLLLRDCPTTGAVCQPRGFTMGIVAPVVVLAAGHVIGLGVELISGLALKQGARANR